MLRSWASSSTGASAHLGATNVVSANDDSAVATDEPVLSVAAEGVRKQDGAALVDFGSKGHELGGLNGIFKTKTPITPMAPTIALRYEDAMKVGHVAKKFFAEASSDALNTFSHYMSYGLVVVKPAHLSMNQQAFLEVHRRTLSLDDKDMSNKIKTADGSFVQLKNEIFIETDRLFIIPKHYALVLYGPCILFPYKTKTPVIRNPFAAGVAPPAVSRPAVRVATSSAATGHDAGEGDGVAVGAIAPPKPPPPKFLHQVTSPATASSSPIKLSSQHASVSFRLDGEWLTSIAISPQAFKSEVIEPMEAAVDAASPPRPAPAAETLASDGGGNDDDGDDATAPGKKRKRAQRKPKKLTKSASSCALDRHLILNNVGTTGEKACVSGVRIRTPPLVYPMDLFGNATNLSPAVVANMPPMTDRMLTRPLRMVDQYEGELMLMRAFPIDQLSIVAGVVLNWRNGLKFLQGPRSHTELLWSSSTKPNAQSLPSTMVCVPCGMGKTLMFIACWMLAMCSIFDKYAGKDLNTCFGGGRNDEEEMELRRACSTAARRTLKAAFVVHGIDLMEQTAEVIAKYVPDARIGFVQEKKRPASLEEFDIVMVSADTLARQEFDDGYFDCISILGVDESHQYLSSMFLKSIRKIPARLMLCLTATPREWALPYLLGPILAYPKRPYEPQYVNMIVYDAGECGGRTRSVMKQDMPDIQGQLSDLVVDLTRNAWIIHANADTTIIGKVPTHQDLASAEKVLRRTLYEVGDAATRTKMFSLDRGTSTWDAIKYYKQKKEFADGGDAPPPTPATPTPPPAPAKAPAKRSISSFFGGGGGGAAAAPAVSGAVQQVAVAAPKQLPQSSSFSSKLFGASLSEMAAGGSGGGSSSSHSSSSLQSPPKTETLHLYAAWSPKLAPRSPIIFSDSIQHLIMLQHWQAQHWIDTCSEVPREHLRIVRVSLRVLAVVDMRSVVGEHDARGVPFEDSIAYIGKSPVDQGGKASFQWSEDCEKRSTVAKQYWPEDISFGPAFWKRWFNAYPVSKSIADEYGLVKPTSDGELSEKAPAWKKRKFDSDMQTKLSAMRAMSAAAASPTLAAPQKSMFPSSLADATVPTILIAGDAASSLDHEASQWMYRCSFFWTPIYGPLPRATATPIDATMSKRASKGAWKRVKLTDERTPLPGVLATFGLLIGDYPSPPQLAVTCTRPHIKEALDTRFPFATHLIASTGVDKQRLCCKTDATQKKDDEQSDGRCKRYVKGKHPFLKNEFVECYSNYVACATAHIREYADERRIVRVYAIEST